MDTPSAADGDPGPPTSPPAWSWSTDVAQARWWVDRLGPMGGEGLAGIVPAGFEAVTRIFHPIEHDDGRLGTWAELARANGRIAHPEMQLHAIATPVGQPVVTPSTTPSPVYVSEGDLPDPPRSILAEVLAAHTTTPDRCWFGVWDGYGRLHTGGAVMLYRTTRRTRWRRSGRGRWFRRPRPEPGLAPTEIVDGPRVRAPDRDYLLLRGPLDAVDAITGALGHQCPNLWWPEDQAWFLITEIDFGWTYVAGPAALTEAIEGTAGIEARPSGLGHHRTVEGDGINR